MTAPKRIITLEEIKQLPIGPDDLIERPERGGGSGAIACCEGREADEHQAERKDSREDSPGCAGEALAIDWIPWLKELEAEDMRAAEVRRLHGTSYAEGYHIGRAAAFFELRQRILGGPQPEPDSEARNERSGRRNSPSKPPEGSASH